MRLIWLIFSLISIFFMARYHAIYINGCNHGAIKTDIVAPANTSPSKSDPKDNSALLFNWSKADVTANPEWNNLRDSLRAGIPSNGILEITGKYYADEAYNGADFENLGIERASIVRDLFKPYLADVNDIKLRSEELSGSVKDKKEKFEAIQFSYFKETATTASTSTLPSTLPIIYFDYGSKQIKNRSKIDAFLVELAAYLKTNDDKVKFTGHSDATSPSDFNYRLGINRAKQIQSELTALGVASNRILVASEGETSPISDKDDRLNRRVEVQIIK